ncbi:glucans biosynthesis glucosyltransferase MdoH [Bradyrhizobium sp. LHD-71]|uniref:glucans biosynthesis glucosyltransferase MdoH n=1 Tax=Bradyrhizobium sp. LHD-71 TaxID=3072141 RepID=UPI00280D17E6|nr:glucans biosynthesis glucosyltransferase MdoH [Bradyrhizobium sp. LHD-71]MDQ8730271.1 glucans biosynthesis glucosyltransferase MdoH [Bradyrhizobium sp. LHD-71]
MLERSPSDIAVTGHVREAIAGRRALFGLLVGATILALLWLAFLALSPAGFGPADAVLLFCFALTLPWMVVGFWNAALGFLIARFAADPLQTTIPCAAHVPQHMPIIASTAILLCIRNEEPQRLVRNLQAMMSDLAASGYANRFHVHVLSDTSDASVARMEATAFADLALRWKGRLPLTYRRRETNTGYKAGNIGDFCARWGDDHEFALVLDADSFMSARAILRLVRIAQGEPQIGILQSLVVGLPSTSAFARIFQFGMRLGMRSYTLGSAWWQGDCGPYWGHNALLRLKPFLQHAQLPLPKSDEDHILSHDQIEAVLMRRGGYDVHVVPEEHESWEENPPSLPEFIGRDLRWCRGNLQYWRFLAMPGLKFVSRCQLLFAILMFLGSPGWIGLLIVGTLALAFTDTPANFIRADAGLAIFVAVLVMWFAPKIATVIDIFTRADARNIFGGSLRFGASVATEMIFFVLLSQIMWFGHALLIASLPFGRPIEWAGQVRDDHSVSIAQAVGAFWPHTLLGVSTLALLAATHPQTLPYALFLAGGLALSIPLAVVTAKSAVGRRLTRWGIGRLPEETTPPACLQALALPALDGARRPQAPIAGS